MNHFNLVEKPRDWLNDMAMRHHYMHRKVHQRSVPFGWALSWNGNILRPDDRPCGFIVYASIHYVRLHGEFGYEGLPTKWQVLSLARLWIHPDFQRGGELYNDGIVPGYVDRKGVWRSTLATEIIKDSLGLVQVRWLQVHPPRYIEQPYHIRKIISYADTRYFNGTIYRAAGFRELHRTKSQKRHKNTRGVGMENAELICFAYDLPEPNWSYIPAASQLELPL